MTANFSSQRKKLAVIDRIETAKKIFDQETVDAQFEIAELFLAKPLALSLFVAQDSQTFFVPAFATMNFAINKNAKHEFIKFNAPISPDELAPHGFISFASNYSDKLPRYICPFCGSGSHENQTGALSAIFSDGIYKWFCHSCMQKGEGKDNIHIFAAHFGLNPQADFQEICRRAIDDFNLDNHDVSHAVPKPNQDEHIWISEKEHDGEKNVAVRRDAEGRTWTRPHDPKASTASVRSFNRMFKRVAHFGQAKKSLFHIQIELNSQFSATSCQRHSRFRASTLWQRGTTSQKMKGVQICLTLSLTLCKIGTSC